MGLLIFIAKPRPVHQTTQAQQAQTKHVHSHSMLDFVWQYSVHRLTILMHEIIILCCAIRASVNWLWHINIAIPNWTLQNIPPTYKLLPFIRNSDCPFQQPPTTPPPFNQTRPLSSSLCVWQITRSLEIYFRNICPNHNNSLLSFRAKQTMQIICVVFRIHWAPTLLLVPPSPPVLTRSCLRQKVELSASVSHSARSSVQILDSSSLLNSLWNAQKLAKTDNACGLLMVGHRFQNSN